MSPSEISSRLSDKWTQYRERIAWKRGPSAASQIDLQSVLDACQKIVAAGAESRSSQNEDLWGQERQRVSQIHACNGRPLLDGYYSPLGAKPVLLDDWNWHRDITSGYIWQNTFYADLKLYNLPGSADIKYVWELSRHQFLFDLAANWWLTDCQRSAEIAFRLWDSWIEENPLYQGVNWTSGLEVAMRSFSWIWSLSLLAQHTDMPAKLQAKIVSSLVDHARYLQSHLSYYSSPYNHLIGEATGLLLLGEILADHPEARAWRQQAIRGLQGYTPMQFYQDGYTSEQACSYHFYTLGFLVMAMIACRQFDRPMQDVESAAHAAFLTALTLRRPDGTWPALGDLDSARAMPVNPPDFWCFDSICHCGAVLFSDDRLAIGETSGPEVFWLFGRAGIEKWSSLKRQYETRNSQPNHANNDGGFYVLKDSGYMVAHRKNDWLLMDAGPISAGLFPDATPSTAHGHADTLQVLYQCNGKAILEDSGIPFYNGDPNWIRYFRSAAAHNTVEIEGVELVRFEGRLAWSCEVARPEMAASSENGLWLMRGKLQWPGVQFERCVLGIPDRAIWVADWIDMDEKRQATWSWQLPSDAAEGVADQGEECFRLRWGDFQLLQTSKVALQAELIRAEANAPQGWRCHGYGQMSPGAVLRLRRQIPRRCLVVTVIGRPQSDCVGVAVKDFRLGDIDAPEMSLTLGGFTWSLKSPLN